MPNYYMAGNRFFYLRPDCRASYLLRVCCEKCSSSEVSVFEWKFFCGSKKNVMKIYMNLIFLQSYIPRFCAALKW
eukprot:UN09453